MGKNRGLRDFIIVIIAVIGTLLIIFSGSLSGDGSSRSALIIWGVIFIITALAISLSRFLIK